MTHFLPYPQQVIALDHNQYMPVTTSFRESLEAPGHIGTQ